MVSLKHLKTLIAVVAALNGAVAPAFADDTAPYFRYRTGSDGDQGSQALTISGSPAGAYYTRVGGLPAAGAPSASMSPVAWSSSGALPPGITVDPATGALTGAATTVSNYGPLGLVATYTPSKGAPVTATGPSFSINVLGSPFIAYAPPPLVPAGNRYDLRPTVSGVGRGKYAFNGTLPAGLSLDTYSGTLSVLPTATGVYPNLSVTVTDYDGLTAASSPFTITVGNRYASLTAPDKQTAVTGVPFSMAFGGSGLASPVTYQVVAGQMPPGLSFCSGPDRICGTATQAGTYPGLVFSGTGSDGLGAVTQQPITITVASPTLTYQGASISLGKPFTITPTSTYLTGATYAFAGPAPAGVTVDPNTGVVSGTLSSSGSNTLTVVATTPNGTTASNPFVLTGKLDAFTVTASSDFVTAHVGYPISQQLTASATGTPMTWAVTSGALPDGLLLNPNTGLVSGAGSVPAVVSNVVVTATGSGASSTSNPLGYNIMSMPSLPAATAYSASSNQPFTLSFSASNLIGTGSYTTDPAKLPPGLLMASNGTLSGTPTTPGTYDGIVVAVTDGYDGATGRTKAFTIDVVDTSGNLYAGGIPSLYTVRQNNALTTQSPTVSGTNYPVVWTLAPDSAPLPTGMALNPATGVISGTPTSPGDTANIILVATEVIPQKADLGLPQGRIRLASNDPSWAIVAQATGKTSPGRSARTRSFTISVAPPLAVENVQPSYALKVASPVSVAPQVQGAIGSTTWQLTGGTLPNAVSFDTNTGRIAGPALTAGRVPLGAQNLKLTAVDSFDGATASSTPFAFTVEPGLAVIGPTALGTLAGKPYDSGVQFTVTNAVSNLSWQVVGSLPAGFTVNPATGAITGSSNTPSITGNLRMAATQVDGTTGVSAPFTFTVQGGLTITYPTYMVAHLNVPMPPVVPSVSGGTGSVSWGIASGSLPPGLTLDTGTGALAGTPTAGGFFYNIQIGATDSTGNNGVSQPLTLYVNNGLSWGVQIQPPVSRYGTAFTSNRPQIAGASGAVTYKLVGNLWDWTVDPNTGIITGHNTPGSNGSYIYPDWLIATDSTGASITHPMILDNNYPALSWFCTTCSVTAAPNTYATADGGYMFNLIGKATYSKVETNGPWPSWITLNTTTGAAYGLTPGSGSYTFTTMLTDSADGSTVQITRSITVDPNKQPNGNGASFSRPPSTCAVGGQFLDTGPGTLVGFSPSSTVKWTDYFGGNLLATLPGWLNFDTSSGRIYGTVANDASGDWSSGGLSSYETATDPTTNPVTSIDSGGLYVSSYARFDVVPPPQTTTGYVVAQYYDGGDQNQRFKTPGGRDNLRLFVSGGNLPPGLNLSSSYYHDTYWLDGTPTTPGTYTFTITGSATQCNGSPVSTSKTITVTVTGATSTYVQSPPTLYGRVGVPFRSPKPTVVNLPAGSDPSQFKWNWGVQYNLPSGLTVDQGDGSIYGVPTQTWTDQYRYTAGQCCYYGYFDLRGLWGNLVITPGPSIQMSDATLLTGTPASVPPKASGFSGQVTWKGANLPPGLGVDQGTGAIVGTPSTPGTYPNVTVSGTEVTLAASYQGDPKAVYPGATSNAFTITVRNGPSISGVADQKRVVGSPFNLAPVANSFNGPVTWSLIGALPAGVTQDPSTGLISGAGTKYGSASIQVSAVDASGLSAMSAPFTLSVTDPDNVVPVDGTATWTWGQQVCTYNCSGSTCSGRQQQTCSGTACTIPSRGCDAPYSGGDTSYPIGMTATSCVNPTPYPSQGYCPPVNPGPGTNSGEWAYNPTNVYYTTLSGPLPPQPFVMHYGMTCLKVGGFGGANCTTVQPSPISTCQLNANGVGNCGSNVRFTDGRVQTTYTSNLTAINTP